MRIFTPSLELPFAGHPVLGTAFVLAGPLQLEELRLETGAGVVPVRLERDGSRIAFGWMRQPPFSFEPFDRADALLALLGVEESGLPVELYRQGPGHVLVELPSPEAVAGLQPDFGALLELGSHGTGCFARDGETWKARVFVPAHGVPEDPATGSAAGPLALHLARHGRIGFGDEIVIKQGGEIGRPSTLHAVARSSEDIGRRIGGRRRARGVPSVRRIFVIGGSCTGKTTVSRRLAAMLGVPHIEVDALHHDPGWQEAPPDVLRARVEAAVEAARDGWVVDGNYHGKRGPFVLERADTVVFLDPPFHLTFARAVHRTIRRTITREELWNGNREQIRFLFTRYWIPWWVLQTHRRYAREIPERVAEHPHLDLVHLRSPREVAEFLDSIQPWAARV